MPFTSCFRRAAIVAMLLALAALPRPALAQADATRTFGFVSARYSNATADFILAGYGYGHVFGMVGVSHNPRTDYDGVLAGVGARFSLASWDSYTVAVAYAEATESPYVQLFVLPSFTLGSTTIDALLQVYAPGSSAGTWQLGVNPVSVFTRVAGPLSVGASYQTATKAHGLPQHKAGPQLRLAIPRGVMTVEVFEGIKRFSDEVRVAVRVGY